jgi:hypothetical protein
MRAAARLLTRLEARVDEELRAYRPSGPASFPSYGAISTGPQLPLSFAPYRLSAADRWWQQTTKAETATRKRRS